VGLTVDAVITGVFYGGFNLVDVTEVTLLLCNTKRFWITKPGGQMPVGVTEKNEENWNGQSPG
jgi:hypothetical protein